MKTHSILFKKKSRFNKNQKNPFFEAVLHKLQLRFRPERTFLIGGTNGKGSVATLLSSLLKEETGRVGLFTSPHLLKVNERISINGQAISDEDFFRLWEELKRLPEFEELSFFDVLTLIACLYFFRENNLDGWVFEVGLGGQCDPTFVIPHDFSVLTTIALDHQHLLGDTLQEIARVKLGLLMGSKKSVLGPSAQKVVKDLRLEGEFPQVMKENSEELRRLKIKVTSVEREESQGLPKMSERAQFYENYSLVLGQSEFPLSLGGRTGLENTQLALAAALLAGFQLKEILPRLNQVQVPGRLHEVKWGEHRLLISGAHNQEGIKSLCKDLEKHTFPKLCIFVFQNTEKATDLERQAFKEILETIPRAQVRFVPAEFYSGPTQLQEKDNKNFAHWLEQQMQKQRGAGVVLVGSLYGLSLLGDKVYS